MSLKRNLWSDEETLCLLDIINEKRVNDLLDGKKYKSKNVYLMIETELKKCGYNNKNVQQINNKWRKMKSEYFITKKNNKISGSDRNVCPYYEKLNEILGPCPGKSFKGIDTSREYSSIEHPVDVFADSLPLTEVVFASSCAEQDATPARKKIRKIPYEKSIAHCTQEFTVMQEKLQNDFIAKQKELIDYEHALQQQHEKQFLKEMLDETEKLLDRSREKYFAQLQGTTVYEENDRFH